MVSSSVERELGGGLAGISRRSGHIRMREIRIHRII